MSLFNELGKKLGGAAEVAADKAKDLAEITKLTYEISAAEKRIEDDYAEIGKIVFPLEKDNPDSPVAALCQKIVLTMQAVDSLNARIAQIKSEGPQTTSPNPAPNPVTGKRYCPACGQEVTGDGKFCQNCGTPLN
ncbi:MAG TPA: zinc ribbon domain-containing protein [Candidatus Acidoferrum sp.]|nr:zinc ribbon domain-containing protein [Candidatus Acidoferrum sp.]